MNIRALPIPGCTLFAFFLTDPQSGRPIQVSPQDLGYEIDEEELASEMLAQLRDVPTEQTAFEVEPDEFEIIYQWFLS